MVWAYRKALTINSSLTPGALTNFPLLFTRTSDADLIAHAQADGDDIAFFDSDETTQLDHEIESYSSGTLIAHIRKPSLPATGNPIIYMYYGDAALSPQQNPGGVWDATYMGVWHLHQNPGDTAPQMLDSSGNNNHGTAFGGPVSATGKIHSGLSCDGINDRVDIANHATLQATNLTVSAWINPGRVTGFQDVVHKWTTSDNRRSWLFLLNGSEMEFWLSTDGIASSFITSSGAAIGTGSFVHLAATYAAGATTANFYKNAVAQSKTGTIGTSIFAGTSVVRMASLSITTEFLQAVIDEIRLASVVRSVDWITTEYNNQNDPGAFITTGSEQPVGGVVSAATYYRRMLG